MSAQVDWEDYKIILTLIREKSLMAAAEELEIHHATVLRRIRDIEKKLDTVLFNRHSRGHTPTEAAMAILPKLQKMEEQTFELFQSLEDCKDTLQGKLYITTAPGLVGVIKPMIKKFSIDYPQVELHIILSTEKLKLENNEAQISIRAGKPATELDYISKKIGKIQYALYATKDYIKKNKYKSNYQFVRTSKEFSHIPIIKWMCENIPEEKILYRTNLFSDIASSVVSGIAVGPMILNEAKRIRDLVQVEGPKANWDNSLYINYHKNIKNNKKLQLFKEYLVKYLD